MRKERAYRRRRRVATAAALLTVTAVTATIVSLTAWDWDRAPVRVGLDGVKSSGAPPARPTPTQTPTPTPVTSLTPAAPNLYAAITDPSGFSPAVAGVPERVYVPNTLDGTVSVIDPRTYRVIRTIHLGGQPHHVTPSWDLRRLYVDNPATDLLAIVNPRTAHTTGAIRVASPYNLYFTPDGRKAIVVAEYDNLVEFRNPHTWRLLKQVHIPWPGVDHMDFSANGRYLLVSCEYSGVVVRINTVKMAITGSVRVGGLPIDVKVSPDGKVFYVANQGLGGVSVIDPERLRKVAFIRTGLGAHGFAVSRNARDLYVSNRLAGSISVISFRTRRVIATWRVGGTPDMLQVSPSGKQLWASNRYGDSVVVISTATGRVIHLITVGRGPHGLTFFPQPGRFSLGHNGVYR